VLGSLVEGETTVVLAGYAAHQGYAPLWAAMRLTAGINFLLDLTWFLLGRWRSPQLLARFMVGLRTAGPIALGIATVRVREFIVFNALGAVVWSVTFAGLGYVFGRVIAVFRGHLAHYEMLVGSVIAIGGLCFLLWRCHHKRLRDQAS